MIICAKSIVCTWR